MSQAHRMTNEIEEATEILKSAASAATQHRNRGTDGTWSSHIADLADLTTAAETLHHMLTQHLVTIAKACAEDFRSRYFHDADPDGHAWPQDVKQAATEADRALSWLRRYLAKTPGRRLPQRAVGPARLSPQHTPHSRHRVEPPRPR